MKKLLYTFIILLTALTIKDVSAQSLFVIQNYKVSYGIATNEKEQLIILRSFAVADKKYLLLTNPFTYKTKFEQADRYTVTTTTFDELLKRYKESPYVEALMAAALTDVRLQNAGIDRAVPGEKGIDLTIDLCPSHKPLDRIIFKALFKEFNKVEQPAPVAISVSGKWILKHTADLDWLKSLEKQNQLAITWINHTYNHEVTNLPLNENFLLSPGVNLDIEVLENEKLMLSNGLIPSVFFRFPGLVSNKTLLEKIERYGLIPVGTDAWLAKGQKANAGSIVLIHGNGNEEVGVRDFLSLLKKNQTEVMHHHWSLFDLSESLEKEY